MNQAESLVIINNNVTKIRIQESISHVGNFER